MNLRRAGAALAAGLLPLVLLGCGSDEPANTSGDSSSSPSSAAAEESTAAAESSEDQVTGGGLSFALPEGWTKVEAADVQDRAEGSSEVDAAAEEMGMDPAQLTQMIGQAEVLLLDPESDSDGFASTINVMVPGGAMPPESEIEGQFSAIGGKVREVTTEQSDLGEVVSVAYVLPVSGNRIQGQALATEVDGEMVTVTVSTADRAETTRLAEGVLSSLTAAQ